MRPCSGPWGDQSLARGRGWAGKGKEADGKGRDMGIVGMVRVCGGGRRVERPRKAPGRGPPELRLKENG